MTFNVFVSIIPPLTLAVIMTILYMFIFELNRIKLILQGKEDFDKKYKQLQIIRGICIFLTFVAFILIAVNNLDFNFDERDQFLTDENRAGFGITSGLLKLIVDTFIYWNLYESVKYLYREF